MYTRWGATVLICGLCAGIAAGCGGSSPSTTTSSTAAPAAASAPATTRSTTTAAPTTTAARASSTSSGPQITVTPTMIANAQVACGHVGEWNGPEKSTLEQACSQLTSGDVSGAVATYNSICRKAAATATAADRAIVAKACPTLVLH